MADNNGDGLDDLTGQPVSGGPALDPGLAAFLAGSGIDVNSLLAGGTPAPTSQADIAAAALQAARDASGSYSAPLPWWAQGVRKTLISQDQFGGVYNAGEGLVYLGSDAKTTEVPANKFAAEMGGDTRSIPAGQQDYALTVTQAQNLPYTWDEKEVADAIQRLKDAGLQVDSFDMGSNSLVNVWSALVNRAAQTYALTDGKRKLTPWDVLDLYKNEAQTTNPGYTGTKTKTMKSIGEISEGQAFAALHGSLSEMLGRDPTDQEVRDFTYRTNRLMAENPRVTKTIAEFRDGKQVGATVRKVADPGYTSADVAQAAYDQAQNEPDYAEYRGASYLYNAVLSALGPIGG